MPDTLTIVPAGAGSGKTYRIKTTLTEWVRNGTVRPERILAVTFTEAAAGELRERIRASLLDEGMVEEALAVERAYVSTIHGLGLRILTEHAFAVGASPRARHLSDAERDLLIRQELARSEALKPIHADLPRYGYSARFWANESAEDSFRTKVFETINLLRGLGDVGTDPALATHAVVAIRKAYGAVTKDGVALEDRLRMAVTALLDAFPQGCTHLNFNKTANNAFRKDLSNLGRALRPDRLSRDWGLWNSLRSLRQSKGGAPTPEGYDGLAADVMTSAEGVLRHPGPLEDACRHLTALINGAQEIMARYAECKREAGVIDFGDMIVDAERMLRTRPEVLDALLAEVDCVIVDEFQDTNPIQFALLWRLASCAPRTLLVGDTKQSIMGFQGADPRLTEALVAGFPGQVTPLDRNWRSDPRIMTFVNAVGAGLFGDGYDALTPMREATGETCLEVLRVHGGRGRSKKAPPEAHVAARVAEFLAEAAPIIDRHTETRRAVQPGDIAVLCQTHAHAARYADALQALGVPVRINREGWLASRPVAAARHALTFVADPSDTHAALCLLTLGPTAMPLQEAMTALADRRLLDAAALAPLAALTTEAAVAPLEEMLPRVLAAAGLHDWALQLPEPSQMRADLIRLEHEAVAFADSHRDMKAAAGFHGATAPVFLGWLDAQLPERDFNRHPDPSSGAADGVEIVTWHASKGREWNILVVTGLDKAIGTRPGTLIAEFTDFSDLDTVLSTAQLRFTPGFAAAEKTAIFTEASRPNAEADARRLLYVALTRARDRLVLEWPEFALKKEADSEGYPHFAALLIDACGIGVEPGGITLSGTTFPAFIRDCPDEAPGPEERSEQAQKTAPAFGTLRELPTTTRTPWRKRPSALVATGTERHGPITTHNLGAPVPALADVFSEATTRGTAWHLAFRTLAERPDLADRLPAATGLDAETIEAIGAQAGALRDWLAAQGFPKTYFEVPIQITEPSGAQTNAVIDCLAEGPEGLVIVDHKSGSVLDYGERFATYWPQLAAYQEAVAITFPAKPVRMIGINWMTMGWVSYVDTNSPTPDPGLPRGREKEG